MTSELVVAIVVAGLIGVFSLPTSYLHCWRSWSWRLSLTALVVHIGLVGLLGGLVGWGSSRLLKDPAFGLDSWFLIGVVYGLIGSVFVLADVKTLVSRDSSGSNGAPTSTAGLPEPPAELKEAASIVGSSARFWTKTLDKHCASLAKNWLDDLTPPALEFQAAWLRAEVEVGDLAVGARREILALVDAAMEQVVAGNPAARASMIAFGRRIIVSLHLEKPRRVVEPANDSGRRKAE